MAEHKTQAARQRIAAWAVAWAVVFSAGCAAAQPARTPPTDAEARAAAEAQRDAFDAPALAMARPLRAPERAEVAAAGADVERAFETLHGAPVFEGVRVGYAGDLSERARAFRVIHTSPRAGAVFGVLADSGTAVGRLYGAIGLRHHDAKAYAVAVEALRGVAHLHVRTRMGCLGGGETVGALLEDGSGDAVRLGPGQTLDAWFKSHTRGVLDVVGGGYTASFTAASP